MASIPNLPIPSLEDYWQDLFDSLNDAYWQASTLDRKDQIKAAEDEAYDIVSMLDEADLTTNTVAFAELSAKIKITNAALEQIKTDITNITKDISTAASVVSAIDKVLSLAALFP